MESNYQEIKDLNPNFNFLVRPHPEVPSTIVAQYGLFGFFLPPFVVIVYCRKKFRRALVRYGSARIQYWSGLMEYFYGCNLCVQIGILSC